MPSNKQRREAAKEKLERQLQRRAAQARRRRAVTVGGLAVVAVAAVAAVLVAVVFTGGDDTTSTASSDTASSDTASPEAPESGNGGLPPFVAPADLGQNCSYPARGEAAKPVERPQEGAVPTEPALVSASITTNQGNIGLQLDNGKAPCTVNSFANLAQSGYFNDTPCHRLTTDGIFVLQCGDPTGQGTGGPGYAFANEYPTNQYPAGDPALQSSVIYPRGTLAMANSGPDTNGSQFFLVYNDSPLAPNYTAFGTIDETGLATLQRIADAGTDNGAVDGPPRDPVTITTALLD